MLRSIQIAVLDDEHGVNDIAWTAMKDHLDEDIYNAVEATDGRYYLPTDWVKLNA